jgi:hypothetical protein
MTTAQQEAGDLIGIRDPHSAGNLNSKADKAVHQARQSDWLSACSYCAAQVKK